METALTDSTTLEEESKAELIGDEARTRMLKNPPRQRLSSDSIGSNYQRNYIEEDYEVQMLKYDAEDHNDENERYKSGKKTLNISAAAIVFKCMTKIMNLVNEDLHQIVLSGNQFSYSEVRKFAVNCMQLDGIEIMIQAALSAPLDDLFYK